MAQRVRLRHLAATDVEQTSAHYRREAGEQTALDFIDDLERGIRRLSRSPQLGSLRFSYELAVPELRAWPLQQFHFVVFYRVTEEGIDVWRILHTRRDVPAAFEPPST